MGGHRFVREDFAETFTALDIVLLRNQINFDCLLTLYPPGTYVLLAAKTSTFFERTKLRQLTTTQTGMVSHGSCSKLTISTMTAST